MIWLGQIEGRKRPKTKEEQQAEWKREHEAKQAEHERQRKEWEAEKVKRLRDAPAETRPPDKAEL